MRRRDALRLLLLLLLLLLQLLQLLDVQIRMRLDPGGQEDLVALGVDDAGARLVARLELDLALERLDLLLVQEVAVLVAVLDVLLLADQALVGRQRRARHVLRLLILRLLLLFLLLLIAISDGDLGLLSARYGRLCLGRRRLLSLCRLLGRLHGRPSSRHRVVCRVL